MKKSQLCTVIFAGTFLFFFLLLLPLKSADNLYDSVIRIHVLANSDSPKDQENKLAVRDSILEFANENFTIGTTREEAKTELEQYITVLEEISRETLSDLGSHQRVKVTIGEEYYPTREYETLSLPAGKYLSLRVQIGEAKGQNWWCVLFPPLCLSSSVDTEDALTGAGMDEDNVSTVIGNDGFRVRFKILELFGKAKKALEELF